MAENDTQAEDPRRFQRFGTILQAELDTRGWTTRDVAERTPALSDASAIDQKELELDLILYTASIADPHVIVNEQTLRDLDEAFEVSDGFFSRVLRDDR